jgi:homoserine kinase
LYASGRTHAVVRAQPDVRTRVNASTRAALLTQACVSHEADTCQSYLSEIFLREIRSLASFF